MAYAPGEQQIEDLARTVDCPVCNRPRGRCCRTGDTWQQFSHVARLDLAGGRRMLTPPEREPVVRTDLCSCGHRTVAHVLKPATKTLPKRRGECSHMDATGQCPCAGPR